MVGTRECPTWYGGRTSPPRERRRTRRLPAPRITSSRRLAVSHCPASSSDAHSGCPCSGGGWTESQDPRVSGAVHDSDQASRSCRRRRATFRCPGRLGARSGCRGGRPRSSQEIAWGRTARGRAGSLLTCAYRDGVGAMICDWTRIRGAASCGQPRTGSSNASIRCSSSAESSNPIGAVAELIAISFGRTEGESASGRFRLRRIRAYPTSRNCPRSPAPPRRTLRVRALDVTVVRACAGHRRRRPVPPPMTPRRRSSMYL